MTVHGDIYPEIKELTKTIETFDENIDDRSTPLVRDVMSVLERQYGRRKRAVKCRTSMKPRFDILDLGVIPVYFEAFVFLCAVITHSVANGKHNEVLMQHGFGLIIIITYWCKLDWWVGGQKKLPYAQ
jgi:hypothetical protein